MITNHEHSYRDIRETVFMSSFTNHVYELIHELYLRTYTYTGLRFF